MYLLFTIHLTMLNVTMLNVTKVQRITIKFSLQEYFCKLKKRNIL
jgi:hypothetical protein